MSGREELTITVNNTEEYEILYQELKADYPNIYRIEIDSFNADSLVQIIIPLAGIIATSSVLAKIFDRNVISVEGHGWKFSGHKKNLPEALECVNNQTQKQDNSVSQ